MDLTTIYEHSGIQAAGNGVILLPRAVRQDSLEESARRVVTDDGCMRLLVCVLVGIPVRVLLVAAGGQSRLNHRQGTKI